MDTCGGDRKEGRRSSSSNSETTDKSRTGTVRRNRWRMKAIAVRSTKDLLKLQRQQ